LVDVPLDLRHSLVPLPSVLSCYGIPAKQSASTFEEASCVVKLRHTLKSVLPSPPRSPLLFREFFLDMLAPLHPHRYLGFAALFQHWFCFFTAFLALELSLGPRSALFLWIFFEHPPFSSVCPLRSSSFGAHVNNAAQPFTQEFPLFTRWACPSPFAGFFFALSTPKYLSFSLAAQEP